MGTTEQMPGAEFTHERLAGEPEGGFDQAYGHDRQYVLSAIIGACVVLIFF